MISYYVNSRVRDVRRERPARVEKVAPIRR